MRRPIDELHHQRTIETVFVPDQRDVRRGRGVRHQQQRGIPGQPLQEENEGCNAKDRDQTLRQPPYDERFRQDLALDLLPAAESIDVRCPTPVMAGAGRPSTTFLRAASEVVDGRP